MYKVFVKNIGSWGQTECESYHYATCSFLICGKFLNLSSPRSLQVYTGNNNSTYPIGGASQVALEVKNPTDSAGDTGDVGLIPGWEEPLEKEMTTHSSILV